MAPIAASSFLLKLKWFVEDHPRLGWFTLYTVIYGSGWARDHLNLSEENEAVLRTAAKLAEVVVGLETPCP